ncbi:Apolipoprotein N-acyltransferase [Pirellulimonas nuda]|uniref:Apolipoprotein N-acyltransferase n=1 Tax=Pirellulimonas nuda TaxID=2528009 RepID=A0A518DHE8_9BACT|nr:apolipoprotein N-acyltransferase [Pirellulimonas nuda]QDU90894.1 Apolipoprotein N-acyltransferase [Pirellulimonas nuda]
MTTVEEQPPASALRVLLVALVGSVLLFLAQPPAELFALAWVAPMFWLAIVASLGPLHRRGYAAVWLAGVVYWLLTLHWICLPHPLTPIGLVFLAAYLGCYLPAFVAVSRHAVHRLRAPLWLVAPVVWTAGEYVQAHLFTGFLMGAISHSQAPWTSLIQIASVGGAYSVSFVVVLAAAAVYELVGATSRRPAGTPLPLGKAVGLALLIVAAVAGPLLWGRAALASAVARPGPTVALVQANILAVWDHEEGRSQRIMDTHMRLSREAIARAEQDGKQIDLLVWPESMFRSWFVTYDGGVPPKEPGAAELDLKTLAEELGVNLLLGCDRFDADSNDTTNYRGYNSAVMARADGTQVAMYDKTHRVPFGEYIPLASNMPAMYYLTPMSGGLTPGEGPAAAKLGAFTYAPNICFETVVPQVIRRQVRNLAERGEKPDVLVNVTNDAWFWGQSELDMHLNCNIYRAVENRTPLVIAANGGLSAVIDAYGRVLEESPRQEETVIVAQTPLGPEGMSFYSRYGDVFGLVCVGLSGLSVAAFFVGWVSVRLQ